MVSEPEVKSSEEELKQIPRGEKGIPHDRLARYICRPSAIMGHR